MQLCFEYHVSIQLSFSTNQFMKGRQKKGLQNKQAEEYLKRRIWGALTYITTAIIPSTVRMYSMVLLDAFNLSYHALGLSWLTEAHWLTVALEIVVNTLGGVDRVDCIPESVACDNDEVLSTIHFHGSDVRFCADQWFVVPVPCRRN